MLILQAQNHWWSYHESSPGFGNSSVALSNIGKVFPCFTISYSKTAAAQLFWLLQQQYNSNNSKDEWSSSSSTVKPFKKKHGELRYRKSGTIFSLRGWIGRKDCLDDCWRRHARWHWPDQVRNWSSAPDPFWYCCESHDCRRTTGSAIARISSYRIGYYVVAPEVNWPKIHRDFPSVADFIFLDEDKSTQRHRLNLWSTDAYRSSWQ